MSRYPKKTKTMLSDKNYKKKADRFYDLMTQSKECTNCGERKDFDKYYILDVGKYGRYSHCATCQANKSKKYREKNKKVINKKRRELYNTDEEVRKKRLENASKYFQENKEKMYVYKRNLYKTNPSYKISVNFRNRLNYVLDGSSKSKTTFELLGCDFGELKTHLEDQWVSDMSWDNHCHDGWHVDHIIPCNAFDLENEHAQAVCFHYSNLRPMWGSENITKYDSIPDLGIEIDQQWIEERGLR